MKQFVSPQGHDIAGIRTLLPALSVKDFDEATLDESGRLQNIQPGDDTLIDWSNAKDDLMGAGERMFEDDLGNVFPESQLHWIDPENGVTDPVPVRKTAS